MAASIESVGFDLSMADIDTGMRLQAKTYSILVENTDGVMETKLSGLSIGQLVMAVCLERAVEKEKEIIGIMNTLNNTSSQLEALTEIETAIVGADGKSGQSVNLSTKTLTNQPDYTYRAYLAEILGVDTSEIPATANSDSADLITQIETAMDRRNSINQQTMIELQSATSKRDQAYDMISNMIKSLHTVMTGIVNNT